MLECAGWRRFALPLIAGLILAVSPPMLRANSGDVADERQNAERSRTTKAPATGNGESVPEELAEAMNRLSEAIVYHTLSTSIKYTQDETDLMFIKDRESMGHREAFHKMHKKYEEALNETKYFKSYDPRKEK